MSKIVVAGGGGFIGSHLVDRCLKEGHEVLVIDDFSTGNEENLASAKANHADKLTIEAEDIRSEHTLQLIADFKPEILYILAAQWSVKVSMRDPLFDATVNVVGLVNLLEAAKNNGVKKVIFASSGGTIYGNHPESELPLKETLRRTPESFYGLTKSTAVDYLRLYKQSYGLDSVALALGNVYGPRQSPYGEAGVIAIFARKMLDAETCVMNGDGETTRDYVHVKDVVNAFYLAGQKGSGLINVGSGIETSVNEVFAAIAKELNSTAEPKHGEALIGEVRRVSLSTEHAYEELGWRTEVSFTEGVQSVLNWMQRD